MKYVSKMITFAEIPTEVTLTLGISNCQDRCPGCHSSELRKDIGTELTNDILDKLIQENDGVSCVLFLGEGNDKDRMIELARRVKSHNLKVALYSGRDEVEDKIWDEFDYVKIGRYIQKLGPLNNPTTNQRLYQIKGNKHIDITNRFWK
jgi:anaerobic ribonucleoside-triphosphate reductase activating protein